MRFKQAFIDSAIGLLAGFFSYLAAKAIMEGSRTSELSHGLGSELANEISSVSKSQKASYREPGDAFADRTDTIPRKDAPSGQRYQYSVWSFPRGVDPAFLETKARNEQMLD